MGIGDEIMMAGEARRRAASRPGRYLMLDKKGRPKWHWIWEGNPDVANPHLGQSHVDTIGYVNRWRPYVVEELQDRFVFREYRPTPAFISISKRALDAAERFSGAVVFNPTIKAKASPNKDWQLERWVELVRVLRGSARLVQIGDGVGIPGAERCATPQFPDACAIMSKAAAVIVHEGALHHAAAAVGARAFVIRGGFISPRVTGYEGQRDFYVDDERHPLGCGMRVVCPHCIKAMASIEPEHVAVAVREVLTC